MCLHCRSYVVDHPIEDQAEGLNNELLEDLILLGPDDSLCHFQVVANDDDNRILNEPARQQRDAEGLDPRSCTIVSTVGADSYLYITLQHSTEYRHCGTTHLPRPTLRSERQSGPASAAKSSTLEMHVLAALAAREQHGPDWAIDL